MEKQEMTKILLPDYIDGTAKIPPSYAKLGHFDLFKRIAPEVSQIEICNQEMTNVPRSILNLLESFSGEIAMRNTLKTFIRVYKGYISEDKNFNNYIFSQNLTKAFSKSSLNIECDNLPKEFNGFLELPNVSCGEKYNNAVLTGSFVSIGFNRLTVLAFGKIDGLVAPVYFSYDIEPGKSLEDILHDIEEAPLFLKTIITAVLYVTHCPEDLIETLNEFPRSEKKAEKLKRHYTQKNLVLVGKFFQLPSQYSENWITNKGHFAWRRHGKGRSLLKYTWISPSKPYQKGQGDNNG